MGVWFLAGCFLPDFEGDVIREGQMALDYTVDRLQVIAVRTSPPLALAGEARTVEALVVAPGGTRHDVAITFEVCGLDPVGTVGITDPRCFDAPGLVDAIGTTNPAVWDVPEIEAPDCISFDAVSDRPDAGEHCYSIVPILATVEDADGEVASGVNYTVVPVVDVPETFSWIVDTGIRELRTTHWTGITTFADPTRPITLTATGQPGPGVVLDLEVTIDDPYYDRVAWWIDGGILDQTGRTVIGQDEEGIGHSFNRWILPEDAEGPLTVWVVLTDWFGTYGAVPSPHYTPTAQPAWAELTVEIAR